MSTATLNIAVEFQTITCCRADCGVQWAMTSEYIRDRRKDHGWFHCPNGHPQHFSGETAQEKRIRELEAEQARLSRVAKEYRQDYELEAQARQQVQRSLAATKGVLTKTRKRVAHGVCPCCGRTFPALAKHMAAKHPEYVAEAATPAPQGAPTDTEE